MTTIDSLKDTMEQEIYLGLPTGPGGRKIKEEEDMGSDYDTDEWEPVERIVIDYKNNEVRFKDIREE